MEPVVQVTSAKDNYLFVNVFALTCLFRPIKFNSLCNHFWLQFKDIWTSYRNYLPKKTLLTCVISGCQRLQLLTTLYVFQFWHSHFCKLNNLIFQPWPPQSIWPKTHFQIMQLVHMLMNDSKIFLLFIETDSLKPVDRAGQLVKTFEITLKPKLISIDNFLLLPTSFLVAAGY